jgi:5'-nucleotidase
MSFSPLLKAASSSKKGKKITILHTNDTHSNIDPFPSNHPKYPGMGGVAKRAALIEKIRKEEENVVLLDSGDIFQGTPYFNTFKGELEMKLMTYMGYDAATMGNHDFDIGLDGFLNAKQYAEFPFVCSNYDFDKTILTGKIQKNCIIKRGGIRIGIFGIGIALEGLISKDNCDNVVYLDPIKTANEQAEELKKAGCDLIICLSHLGYVYQDDQISDKVLAAKTKNIHLILGGHTHTFLTEPTIINNSDKQPVMINQTGWGGINLGRIDIDIENRLFGSKLIEVK